MSALLHAARRELRPDSHGLLGGHLYGETSHTSKDFNVPRLGYACLETLTRWPTARPLVDFRGAVSPSLAMLLAADAGNSSVSFAVFRGSEVLARFHTPYAAQAVTAENLLRALESRGINPTTISAFALASVGPHLPTLQRELRQLGEAPLLTVEVDPQFGMPLAYANPRELGVDRWLNAVAAYHQHRQAVIVVDMGTATNFECVSAAGEFLGGAICVGPQLSLDALCQRSTRLPHIQLTTSDHVLADNSRAALLSGAYHGHAAMIDGMVARLSAEMSTPVRVIGTGGYSALFAPVCRSLNVIEPDLTLHGVRLVWERHRDATPTTP